MVILPTVDSRRVAPALWQWLHTLDVLHQHATGEPLTITSLRRPMGPRPSRHSPPGELYVTAADLRRWALDRTGRTEEWARELQRSYGVWLGVVVEPEWLTPAELELRGGVAAVGPHVHVQLKGGA